MYLIFISSGEQEKRGIWSKLILYSSITKCFVCATWRDSDGYNSFLRSSNLLHSYRLIVATIFPFVNEVSLCSIAFHRIRQVFRAFPIPPEMVIGESSGVMNEKNGGRGRK